MFDAVGIQFGMDQMVEASSDQISAFTHWYLLEYMNIGIGVQALYCGLLILGSCMLHVKIIHHKDYGKQLIFIVWIYSCNAVTSK